MCDRHFHNRRASIVRFLAQKLAHHLPAESPIRRRILAGAFLATLWADYMTGDSIRSRIARGAFWCVMGTGISQAMGLGAAVVCARLLGSGRYGQLGIVLTTVNLFATIATVGLGVTATKHVAEYKREDPTAAGRIVGMSSMVSGASGSLIAILLIVLAPWLSTTMLKAPLAIELQLGALMMLFAAVNGYQTGTLAGFEAFKVQAILNTIRGLCAFPAIVTGVFLGGIKGALIGYTVASAANFLFHEIAIRRQCRLHSIHISYGLQKSDLKLLWSFSLPVLIASFSFTPAVWWTSAKLGTTAGYTQLGIFNAGQQWQNLVLFFSNAVAILGLPTLSAVLPERSIVKYTRMLKINFCLTTSLAAVIAVPVGLAAPWIMSFYGHGFVSGVLTLRLICVATVISSMNMSVGDAIWSLSAARAGMLLSLLRGAALVVGAMLFTTYGAAGLAGAYVFMTVVQTIVQGPFLYLLLRKQAAVWAVPQPALEQA